MNDRFTWLSDIPIIELFVMLPNDLKAFIGVIIVAFIGLAIKRIFF